eukprot:g27550.t1
MFSEQNLERITQETDPFWAQSSSPAKNLLPSKLCGCGFYDAESKVRQRCHSSWLRQSYPPIQQHRHISAWQKGCSRMEEMMLCSRKRRWTPFSKKLKKATRPKEQGAKDPPEDKRNL